jgi:hypothetical protein
MTEMHPIATVDRGMVQARKLRVGDKVQTQKYESAEQTAKAKLDMRTQVNKHWRQDYVKSATR